MTSGKSDYRLTSCYSRLLAILVAAGLLVAAPAARQQTFDLVIANGRVVDPESGLDAGPEYRHQRPDHRRDFC